MASVCLKYMLDVFIVSFANTIPLHQAYYEMVSILLVYQHA